MPFVVRSSLLATALASDIRRAIARVAPDQPICSTRSLEGIASRSLFFSEDRIDCVRMFALAALLLAVLGIRPYLFIVALIVSLAALASLAPGWRASILKIG